MREFVCAAAAASAFVLLGLDRAAAGQGCALPPRTVRAELDAGGARYEWTSRSGGGAAHYRVELQRGISAQGPFSEVQDVDVTGNAGLSVAYTVSPDVLGAAPHHYWRWRVGQTTGAGGPRFSAWQTFSFR